MNNAYHFVTTWHVEASAAAIFDLLSKPLELVRWWPTVYLAINQREKGDANGIGAVFDLHTKGWLPYTLRWSFRTTLSQRPQQIALDAWGDFVGQGLWTFIQAEQTTQVTYDWNIRAEKPLLRWFTPILRPIFAANHRWAMAQGEASLRRELGLSPKK